MSDHAPHAHETNPLTSHFVEGNGVTNSHLLVNEFDYREAASVEEAVNLLKAYEGRARLLAGGTDLVVMMKMERVAPAAVINISKIPGLADIKLDPQDGSLHIGALATIQTLHNHPLVQARYPGLAEACSGFGSTQVEAMGTLGGNLGNGSPAADTAPVLLVLGAQLVLAGPQGSRTLPVEAFFLKPGKTALQPDEMLTEIILPAPLPGSTTVFLKAARVAADLAKASLAILLARQGSTIATARFAMGSVAPTPIRLERAEALLAGQAYTPELAAEAGRIVSEDIRPIDDNRSTAWYRRQVASAMTQDGLALIWERAAETRAAPVPDLPSNGHASLAPAIGVQIGERKEIELHVNGRKVRVWVAPNELLLNVLREKLELTGTKYACGIGECSACTVQIDGKPVLSCLVLAVSAVGKQIVTVEGLADPETGALDPIQEAFIDNTAFQCGYCTPGILMTARSLLAEIPHPDEEQVRRYLRGNICRCTGYASIVRAVLDAAEREEGDKDAARI